MVVAPFSNHESSVRIDEEEEEEEVLLAPANGPVFDEVVALDRCESRRNRRNLGGVGVGVRNPSLTRSAIDRLMG